MIERLGAAKVRFPLRKPVVFLLLCLGYCLSATAQQEVLPSDEVPFPWGWVGIWQGDLHIHNQQPVPMVIPMELHILPLDTSGHFSWTIIYGEDREAGLRNYVLKTVDATRGHYVIDERNSIVLEAFLLNETLYSRFSVMENLLSSTVHKQGDHLFYEIVAGPANPVSTTGDTISPAGDTIPPVQAYSIRVQQRALLQRQ